MNASNTFRQFESRMLSLFLVLSLGGLTRQAVAHDDIGACNAPCPSATCCPFEDSPGNPPSENSDDPVFFLNGTVIENAVDLRLPGPNSSWSFSRAYDSGLTEFYNQVEVTTAVGRRWMSGAMGPYFASPTVLVATPSTTRDFSSGVPADYHATLETTGSGVDERLVLTEYDSGNVFIFYSFNASIAAEKRGLLEKKTTRALQEAGLDGTIYDHNSDGFVSSVTPAEPQDTDYSIDFTYYTSGAESGWLKKVEITEGTTIVARAEYWYQDNADDLATTPTGDLGSARDLVQVRVSKRATDDTGTDLSIVSTTQYRYFKAGGSDEGEEHQLKMVLESDAIQRLIDYSSGDSIDDPEDLLELADSAIIKDNTEPEPDLLLSAFASRSFTYYTSLVHTNSIDTSFTTGTTTENLDSKYGGYAHDESAGLWLFSTNGVVKSETINGACSACGSESTGGLKKEYYYMKSDDTSGNQEELVYYTIVEDTLDATGTAAHRTVYGVGYTGIILREALLTDPLSPSSSNIWCRSMKVNTDWRLTERRMPSAHKYDGSKGVNSDATLDKFFTPSFSTNDADTVSTTKGVITTYEYTDTVGIGNGKYPTGTLVQKGSSGTAYYLSATDWVEKGTGGKQNFKEVATYTYPSKTSTRTGGSEIKTSYSYDFWASTDDTVTKKITTTLPKIATTQNGAGSGGGDPATTTEQYFDKIGRLRWTKDGKGYVNYYSYHPDTGGLAYTMTDVDDPTDPGGTEVENGSTGKWIAWTVDDANSNKPTRGSGLPTGLELVTKQEYDEQGRRSLTIDADGAEHYTVYQVNQTVRFPYWDSTNSKSLLPITVTVFDNGGKTTDTYSIKGDSTSITATSGVPTGVSSPARADYVSWTRNFYDSVNGQLAKILRYHNVPSSGDGTHLTDYYVTAYDYDDLGRQTTTIQTVQSTTGFKDQISQKVYDALDRVVESKQDAGDSGVDTDPDGDLGTLTLTGLTKVSETEYDDDGVGDGHVTQTKNYYDTTDFIETNFHRTWRGHLRGTDGKNNTTAFGPYPVADIDWQGRTTGQAQYTSAPTWSSVLTSDGYTDFLSSNSTNRNDWTKTHYDDLDRVYQTERYLGTEGTEHFEINNYYDRNNQLVCTGDKYSTHVEYAYDNVGRQYQVRTVTDVESTKYTSGVFNYRAPVPDPDLSSMTGGDDEVIILLHTDFDAAGNTTAQHAFEMNHDDTTSTGIDLSNDDDYVRSSIYSWYNSADQITATANYGSGEADISPNTWEYTDIPGTAPSEPTWTDSKVYEGYVQLTKYGYDSASGRQNLATIGIEKNGSNTTTVDTKTFYDDLGRRVAVAENHDDFALPTSNIGDGTDESKDRVTTWTYNGLGQTVTLTAYNGSVSDDQVTKYYYEESADASLLTHTVYPDSTSTPTSGTDIVEVEYNLDGSHKTMTEQRGVVHTYSYYDSRLLKLDAATTIPAGTDDAVKSIGRNYDSMGRPTTTTSYSDTTGTTAVNEIKLTYNSLGRVTKSEQDHAGAVGGTEPAVDYGYDTSADPSDIYTNSVRQQKTTYPGSEVVWLDYDSSGSLNDRLNRVYRLRKTNGAGTIMSTYKYNGTNRVARVYLDQAVIIREMFSATGDYDSWDRFGQTKKHRWETSRAFVRDQVEHTYDYAGNRLTRDVEDGFSDAHDQLYAYDGLQRLTNVEGGTWSGSAITSRQLEQDWTLDQLGNWSTFKERDTDTGSTWDLDQDRDHNDVNEIDTNNIHSDGPGASITATTGANWIDPKYDAVGNMIEGPSPAVPTVQHKYIYDAWNRLVEVTDSADSTMQDNEYDGLNRRIVRDETGGSGDHRHFYYNQQWQVLEERVEVSSTIDTDPLNQFVYHPYYVDALACRNYDANTDGSSDEQFYLHDANFNVTSLLYETGSTLERYAYSPYGEVTVLDVDYSDDADGISDWKNEYLYTGRRLDPETGLQLNRNRFYHAPLGRWVNRDPIGYDGSQWNLYEYANSNATTLVDAMGLASKNPCPSGWTLVSMPSDYRHKIFRSDKTKKYISGNNFLFYYTIAGFYVKEWEDVGITIKAPCSCKSKTVTEDVSFKFSKPLRWNYNNMGFSGFRNVEAKKGTNLFKSKTGIRRKFLWDIRKGAFTWVDRRITIVLGKTRSYSATGDKKQEQMVIPLVEVKTVIEGAAAGQTIPGKKIVDRQVRPRLYTGETSSATCVRECQE